MIDIQRLHTDWHYRGKCAPAKHDPREWELKQNLKEWQTLLGAAKACLGCPVIRECAIEAVDTEAIGVIRAGLPCPPGHWVSRGNVRQRALEAVARGDNALTVAACIALNVERYTPAKDELLDLVDEHVTPWTLPPIHGLAAPETDEQAAGGV